MLLAIYTCSKGATNEFGVQGALHFRNAKHSYYVPSLVCS